MSLSDHFARDPETGRDTICEAEWLQGPDREPAGLNWTALITWTVLLAVMAAEVWFVWSYFYG